MKTKRQELIDFMEYLMAEKYCLLNPSDDVVDEYLKSINSARRSERRAIGSNKAKVKDCKTCRFHYHLPNGNICMACGVDLSNWLGLQSDFAGR